MRTPAPTIVAVPGRSDCRDGGGRRVTDAAEDDGERMERMERKMTGNGATQMKPLLVRARMAGGVGHGTPWGISLDGLLASQIRENTKAAARAAGTDYEPYCLGVPPAELDLPLARCHDSTSEVWHWAATFAWPEDETPGPHVQYWSARPDQQALGQLTSALPAHVSERQGRYRSHVMPLPLTIARCMTWRAVGDPAAIDELLAGIITIGKKRAAGNGHVLEWSVRPDPDADAWEYSHLHPDGSLGRTAPPGCLTERMASIATGGRAVMGLRPPYMHPSRQSEVLLPAR